MTHCLYNLKPYTCWFRMYSLIFYLSPFWQCIPDNLFIIFQSVLLLLYWLHLTILGTLYLMVGLLLVYGWLWKDEKLWLVLRSMFLFSSYATHTHTHIIKETEYNYLNNDDIVVFLKLQQFGPNFGWLLACTINIMFLLCFFVLMFIKIQINSKIIKNFLYSTNNVFEQTIFKPQFFESVFVS